MTTKLHGSFLAACISTLLTHAAAAQEQDTVVVTLPSVDDFSQGENGCRGLGLLDTGNSGGLYLHRNFATSQNWLKVYPITEGVARGVNSRMKGIEVNGILGFDILKHFILAVD